MLLHNVRICCHGMVLAAGLASAASSEETWRKMKNTVKNDHEKEQDQDSNKKDQEIVEKKVSEKNSDGGITDTLTKKRKCRQ